MPVNKASLVSSSLKEISWDYKGIVIRFEVSVSNLSAKIRSFGTLVQFGVSGERLHLT